MEIMTPVPQGDLFVTDLCREAWHFSWIYSNQSLYALARDRSETGLASGSNVAVMTGSLL